MLGVFLAVIIQAQHAFAQSGGNANGGNGGIGANGGMGGNGGLGGTGVNGGTCTQTHCNASGGNGGNGGNANVQNPQGKNGMNGVAATPCVDGHRTLTSSDGRTLLMQAC